MPAYNLAWKGSPHRRPKINTASPSRSPSIARRAAEEVFRKPLSLSLQKLRRAQAKRHATKVRVSFVHSNGSQNRLSGSARKRSSSQRKQQPSPPKRGANGGAIPGIWQDINYKGGGPRQLPKKKSRGSYPKFGPSDASSSQEDQCCLGSPSKKDAEKPPGAYWGELSRSPVKSPPKVPNQPGEEPSLYFSRDRRSVIKLRPLPPLPKGPSAPMPRPRPNPGTPTSRGKAVARPSPVRPGALQTRKIPMHTEAWVPPETWGSTNRQLKPNKKGSPGGKDRASKNRHIVSRFCNHRKVSNRPIELEEAQPASGASKLPHPPPAIGETQKSIRTVKELLPYQDQFRAAGLAVTSKEQKAFHRRGKLAPLLGKMSPSSGSEWLRLDGGTETNEIVTEVKKDDSPSPINVEQIPLKSGEDKLSNASSPLSTKPESVSKGLSSPGHQSDRQTPCSMHDEEKENIIPTAQPSPAPNPEGIPNSDKTLPALPRVFSQVLVRHGSGPSRNSSWSAAMRQGQFPPTIVEQREPSLDKQQEQRQQPKKRHQPTPTSSILSATSYETAAIVQPAKSYGQLPLQIRNTRQNSVSEVTVITTKTPHPSVVSSIELPKSVVSSMELPGSVRTRTGTPSSLEKALDEAVRRLQAMRETVVANPGTVNFKTSPTSRSKGTGKGKYQHKRSTSSKTVPSPSQKLRMAKALRKEKMFGAAVAVAVGDDHSPRSKPSSPASTCTALVKREDDMRSSLASMGTVEREEGQEVRGMTASPTPTVEEATVVIIPRPRVPSRAPPSPPRPGSVLASIEVHCSPGPSVSSVPAVPLATARHMPEVAAGGSGGHAPLRITRPESGLSPNPAAFPLPPSRPESSRRHSRSDLAHQSQAQFRVSKRSSFISNQRGSGQRGSTHRIPNQRPPSQQQHQRPPTRRQTRPPLSGLFHSHSSDHHLPSTRTCTSYRDSYRHSQRHSNHPDRHLPASDILKGLKIMCAASADEDLDAWFRHKTGLRLRRFLADLRTFEELGEEGMARRRAIKKEERGRERKMGMRSSSKGKGKERASTYSREGDGGRERGRESRYGRELSHARKAKKYGTGTGDVRDSRCGASRGCGAETGRQSTYGSSSWETRTQDHGSSSRTHQRQHRLGGNGISEENGNDTERKRRSGSGRNSIGLGKRTKLGY